MPAAPCTSGSTITAAISRAWSVEQPLQRSRVAGLDAVASEQQRPVGAVEEVDAADRDRAEGVAVVGVARGETNGSRRTCWPPRCCQYWNAIFSAISTAVEPESE